MDSLPMQMVRLVAAAAILLAAIVPASAGATGTYIPGVTDSSTGVLAELERRHAAEDRYIPGVTDSSTGVLRELERTGVEPTWPRLSTDAGDSGFVGGDGIIVAAVFAAAAAAGLGLAAGRRRRVLTT